MRAACMGVFITSQRASVGRWVVALRLGDGRYTSEARRTSPLRCQHNSELLSRPTHPLVRSPWRICFLERPPIHEQFRIPMTPLQPQYSLCCGHRSTSRPLGCSQSLAHSSGGTCRSVSSTSWSPILWKLAAIVKSKQEKFCGGPSGLQYKHLQLWKPDMRYGKIALSRTPGSRNG